jgi:hypothetical protein
VSELEFFRLPVDPDDGLPQALSCDVGPASYDFGLYATLAPPEDDPPDTVYDLAWPSPTGTVPVPLGHLVLRVATADEEGAHVLLLRKLVPDPGLVHYAGPLAITLVEARVARGNLNGSGRFGSRITIGVAQRWP